MSDRNWSINFLGSDLGTSNWLRATRFVNGCAEGKDQPAVFGRPKSVHGGDVCTLEVYERATIKVRANHEATIYCSVEDKELQDWLTAAKAHTMGLSTGKSFSQGDPVERLGDEPFGQGDSIRRLN